MENNYEQKYKKALDNARLMYDAGNNDVKHIVGQLFPELAESEDERIKNRLIKLIKMSNEVGGLALHKWEADEMLAWIEKRSNTSEALEKFKTLQHITGDKKSTVEDWAYTPNLYHFDGSWHVDWISCEEGDSLIGFSAETPEEAIDKAYDWFHSTFCNS